MPKHYIEIDSTYRDRNRFPNPSNFDVLFSNQGIKYAQDAISPTTSDIVLYPSPETFSTVTFYTENLVAEIGLTTEKLNLPYMYSTALGENIVRLDELPISSQDSTDTSISIQLENTRGVEPLSPVPNFYIGDYLEHIQTNEFRRIIKYDFSGEDNVLQSSTVAGYNAIEPANVVLFGQIPELDVFNPALSNIDRYYQGKYIRFTTGNLLGEEALILEYNITSTEHYKFRLSQLLSQTPTPGDKFVIVSKFNYFATLDSPFSNPLPLYPVYRQPLPSSNSYYLLNIDRNNIGFNVNTMEIVNLADTTSGINIGYGIATQTINSVSFYSSNTDGSTWEHTYSYLTDNTFPIWYISCPLTYPPANTLPVLVFLQSGILGDFATFTYVTALDDTGSSWAEAQYQPAPVTEPQFDRPFVAVYDFSTINIVYTEVGTFRIMIAQTADLTGAAGWTYIDTNETGTVGDVILIRPDLSNPIPTYSGHLIITFQDESTGDTYSKISDDTNQSAWTNPRVLISSEPNDYVRYRPSIIQLVYPFAVTTFATVYQILNTGDIYIQLVSELEIVEWEVAELVTSNGNLSDAFINRIKLNRYEVALSDNLEVFYTNQLDDTLSVTQLNFNGVDAFIPISSSVLTTYGNINTFNIVTAASRELSTTPLIAIANNDTISALIAQELSSTNVLYRIRRNIPLASNTTLGTLQYIDTTTAILPSNASSVDNFYVGKYLWIYSDSIDAGVPLNFTLFNDFRQITSYDGSIREITFQPPLATSPLPQLLDTTGPRTTLYRAYDSIIDSNFGNPIYSGSVYSPNEQKLYFIPFSVYDASATPGDTNLNKQLIYIDANDNIGVYANDNVFAFATDLYWDGVYDPILDRIYMVPYGVADEATWHYIDCTTGTLVAYAHGVTAVNFAYRGGVYCPTLERIYFIAFMQGPQANWHYVDCATGNIVAYATGKAAEMFAVGSWGSYSGGALHEGLNRIYMGPFRNSVAGATFWHYIDCVTGTIVSYAKPASAELQDLAYSGAVYHTLLDFVYFTPHFQITNLYIPEYPVHYIDDTGTIQTYQHYTSGNTYYGGVYSPTQNRIYFTPWSIIGNTTNTFHYIDYDGTLVEYSNTEIAIAPVFEDIYANGGYHEELQRIYFAPYNRMRQETLQYIDIFSVGPRTIAYEILNTLEIYTPINNIWNAACSQQQVCYEITLEHLSLPNVILESGYGNRIAFYPYVYVEFTNITNPNRGFPMEIISSNNPHSYKMLFHVPITNVNAPDRAAFVSLKSGMTQTVKFNYHDSFHFSVYLPNGELFQTIPDSVPPFEPNVDIQIVAVFSFMRV